MRFTITEQEYERVMAASQPVAYLIANGTEPTSPQARANAAWQAIGSAHGVEWMSIRPVDEKARLMSGTPSPGVHDHVDDGATYADCAGCFPVTERMNARSEES